ERAAAMSGRVRAKREVMSLRRVSQRIQDQARLHTREPLNRIEFQDAIHVLAEVKNHSDVATLTGEAGACASRQYRRTKSPTDFHRGHHVVSISWNNEPDRNLPIVRAVGGIERAAAPIEPDLTPYLARQRAREVGRLGKRIDRLGVRTER